MRNLVYIRDYTKNDVAKVFCLAKEIEAGKHEQALRQKTFALFFPPSSIRTRVTFEKGIAQMGGQPILFPSDALDKKEDIGDVVLYLNNWIDCVIVRHSHTALVKKMAENPATPIINAMTNDNHPCEILSDLYSLSKQKEDYLHLKYLYVGANSNIGITWQQAARILGLDFTQCAPEAYAIEGVRLETDITKAIVGKDVVLTDSINPNSLNDFKQYQITEELMNKAGVGALLNPCPPFYRGEEVSQNAIESKYFVGYGFKKSLLCVEQAIILFSMQTE